MIELLHETEKSPSLPNTYFPCNPIHLPSKHIGCIHQCLSRGTGGLGRGYSRYLVVTLHLTFERHSIVSRVYSEGIAEK